MTATEIRTRAIDVSGTWTALITPFRDGEIDETALRALVDSNIAGGVSGLVACGTTAETPTLTADESRRVIEIVIDQAQGRVPVMVGTGSNDTHTTLAHTIEAQELGADAALIVMPYYNRPTQEGLYQHIRYVAERVELPIVLYNVPGRTGSDILPVTVARLALLPNVVGIKEASGNLDRASEIVRLTGDDFSVLSGDDSLTLPIMAVGGRGIVSVASNVIPGAISALTTAALEGDFLRARTIHHEVLELCGAMFVETNPVPVKAAAELLGLATSEVRLPMVPLMPDSRERLFRAMLHCPYTAQRMVIGEETAFTVANPAEVAA
jgi:4-hydroxy-tetrahydrodipicolinate synthase